MNHCIAISCLSVHNRHASLILKIISKGSRYSYFVHFDNAILILSLSSLVLSYFSLARALFILLFIYLSCQYSVSTTHALSVQERASREEDEMELLQLQGLLAKAEKVHACVHAHM